MEVLLSGTIHLLGTIIQVKHKKVTGMVYFNLGRLFVETSKPKTF